MRVSVRAAALRDWLRLVRVWEACTAPYILPGALRTDAALLWSREPTESSLEPSTEERP